MTNNLEFTNQLLKTNEEEILHLCFVIEEKIYSLNAKNVLEVVTLPLLNTPQRLPEYVTGILNYNDLFINVIDIRKIFAIPTQKYNLSNKIIIIKGDESLFAIIVDKVTDLFAIKQTEIQRIMGETSNNIIKSFVKKEENVVNIIDITTIEDTVKKAQTKSNTINYAELFPCDEESLCILQKRRQEIAKIPSMNIDTAVYGKDQYLIFSLNEHKYCLHATFIRELINLKNLVITKIPYTPSFILGITNLKGNFYSILDLKNFINIKPDKTNTNIENEKVIILESNEIKLALLVDDIINLVTISKENINIKNDKNLDDLFIKAETYINNEICNILNIDKLINDNRLYIDNSTN